MKALAIEEYGEADVAKVVDVPEPEPGDGEVVVKLEAAALNHLDLWTVGGTLGIEHSFPHTLGADGAGEIAAVGSGAPSGIKEGAKVVINPGLSCGKCEFCRRGEQSLCVRFMILGEHVAGTFAEYVKVPVNNVYPYPDHLSATEAAALGLTFLTAYRMLFPRAQMIPGEWLLITGIGGGLAQALLALARPVAGKIVVTSSSEDKIKRAIDMGADEGVNYAQGEPAKSLRNSTGKRGFDLVADSAGGPSMEMAIKSLRKGGRVVTAGSTTGPKAELDMRRVFWNQLSLIGSTMGSDNDMAEMLRFVGGAKIKPEVDATYKLEDGVQALSRLGEGDRFGKVVLQIA